MQSSAYIAQTEKNIHALINEKKFKAAYLKCKNNLQKFPHEKAFEELMGKIEKLIIKENEEVISRTIKDTKPLWKKGEYRKILEILAPLLKLNKNNDELKNKIIDAQEAYKKKAEKEANRYEKDQRKKLDKLFKKDEIGLSEALFIMEKNNPGNDLVKKLTYEYRDKTIEEKINQKSDLIYSEKYNDIQNFIHQLSKIDKKNPRIKNLELAIKKRKAGTQIDEKSEYVYKGEKHLSTLMRLGRYDKAVQVAREVLEVDRSNKRVISILKKAESKLFKQTQTLSIESIKKNYPALREEYKKNKKKFIKI